ncbi:MAG: redoxin domain-containing protein, partial [Bacteroidia bacterium]|nr:redoxin domain-containing protein [Bacteroidia bacterium]
PLRDVAERPHQLSNYRGKAVMLHFWTDFCVSCRAEFPRIQDYYEELESDQFELIAVNIGQPARISETFHKDFKTTFPMLVDDQGFMADLYAIKAYPTNFFIDPQGKIVRVIRGWVDKNR